MNRQLVDQPFDSALPHHTVDVLIVALWFMLREIEVAAALVGNLDLTDDAVSIVIPLQKKSVGGSPDLTRRTLRCPCRARLHPLCPVHAALRHMRRLRALGAHAVAADRHVFPGRTGGRITKKGAVEAFRLVLQAAGLQTVTTAGNGKPKPVFGGHVARVSGAQFLAAAGVQVATIQLMGRWSSSAVERYVQTAPLVTAPAVPGVVLGMRPASSACSGSAGPDALAIADGPSTGDTRSDPAAATSGGAVASGGTGTTAVDPTPDLHFVPKAATSAQVVGRAVVDAVPTLIMHARSRKVHRASLDEGAADQGMWAAPCGWRYGGTCFFRLSEYSDGADLCRRCFPGETTGEEAADSAPSSSDVSTNSTSRSSSS